MATPAAARAETIRNPSNLPRRRITGGTLGRLRDATTRPRGHESEIPLTRVVGGCDTAPVERERLTMMLVNRTQMLVPSPDGGDARVRTAAPICAAGTQQQTHRRPDVT